MYNKFIPRLWNKQVVWSQSTRKVSLLNFFSMITISALFMVTATPQIFSNHHGDDGDRREEIVLVLGGVGAVAGAAAAAGVASVPAWVPVAGCIAAGAGLAAAGIAIWDWLDGPEDNCNDCDGSGYHEDGDNCLTCNPPDDDGCYDCDGSGCSICKPPPPPSHNP